MKFSSRGFREWLQSLSIEELETPVEDCSPDLAIRLDALLARRDRKWLQQDAHISHALEIVESGFPAMLGELSDSDARALGERWAYERNAKTRALLVDRATESGPIAPADLAAWLRRESTARRAIRIESFDLDLDRIAPSLDAIPATAPRIDKGEICIVEGGYGAGKSELAEAWHQEAIAAFRQTASGGRPVWLEARELESTSLGQLLLARVRASHRIARGVSVVIDGLDEVGPELARRIADDARAFVRADPESSVLITTRGGVLLDRRDMIECPLLTPDAAKELVQTIGELDRPIWDWNEHLVDAIRYPFFALAAGVLMRDGSVPSGQADLLRRLSEHALRRVADMQRSDLVDALSAAACHAIRSDGARDGLSFQQRQLALQSRLVTLDNDVARFTLPIFQQWFAAQALLADSELVDVAVGSSVAFGRWRWVLAVAGIGADSPEALDVLVEKCMRSNPGAGAWVLEQISAGHKRWREDGGTTGIEDDAGARLIRAARIWIDALGDLAPHVLPVDRPGARIRLGFRVADDRLIVGWSRVEPAVMDELVALPAAVSPWHSNGQHEWRILTTSRPAEGVEWPWIWVRQIVAGATLKALQAPNLIGLADGVWHQELRYRTARIISGQSSVAHSPIGLADIAGEVDELHALVEGDGIEDFATIRYVNGRREASGEQIDDLMSFLERESPHAVSRLVPSPDRLGGGGGFIWSLYSDSLIQEFCAELYGLACDAYDEAANCAFGNFSWTLSTTTLQPLRVLAELSFRDVMGGRTPGITKILLPEDSFNELLTQAPTKYKLSSNARAAVLMHGDDSSEGWLADYLHEQVFARPEFVRRGPFDMGWSYSSSIVDVNRDRPISHCAAQWIWRDLKRVHLADGTFPQLD